MPVPRIAFLRRLFAELPAAQTVEQIEALLSWNTNRLSQTRLWKIDRLQSSEVPYGTLLARRWQPSPTLVEVLN